jgi:hypothetical protein
MNPICDKYCLYKKKFPTGCALNDQGKIQAMQTTYAKMNGDDKPATRIKSEWMPIYFNNTSKGSKAAASFSSKCNANVSFQ